MAWADLFTRTTGDVVTSEDWTLLKNALLERTGWVGNAAQNTAANAIPVDVNDPVLASNTTAFQDIIEAIVASYARTGLAYIDAQGHIGSWSWITLAQYIYNTYSAEMSGIGKSGATYDWIRRPTRDTSLLLGNPIITDKVYYEHIRGIVYALDILRWLHTVNIRTWGSDIARYASKYAQHFSYTTPALAWAAMKAKVPSISGWLTAGNVVDGINIQSHGPPIQYAAHDSRALFPIQMQNAWLAGYAPTSWVDGKHVFKTSFGSAFNGPWVMMTAVTASAVGAYGTGTSIDASFSVAAANTFIENTFDTPDAHPKSTGTVYVMVYNPTYDTSPVAVFDETVGCAPANFDMTLKPATVYGT